MSKQADGKLIVTKCRCGHEEAEHGGACSAPDIFGKRCYCLGFNPDIYHEFTREIVCPWCSYEIDGSQEFDNDDGELICENCGKEFIYTRYIEVTYSTERKQSKPVEG